MAKFEFAIKKDVLNNGKIIYTPVCREKSKLGRLFSGKWQRIVQIYERFFLMELDFIPELSYGECERHIQGYQEELMMQVQDQIATVEFHTLEEKEI